MSTNTLFSSITYFLDTYKNPLRYIYALVLFLLIMFLLKHFKATPVFEENYPEVFSVTIAVSAVLVLGAILSLRKIFVEIPGDDIPVTTQIKDFGKMISIFLLFGALVYGILYLLISNYEFSSYILFSLIIGGLVIAALTFSKYKDNILPKEQTNTSRTFRLLKNLIFYIPCFLTHIGTKMYEELKTAPREAYILLGLEGLAITIYIFYSAIKNFIYKKAIQNGEQLLRDPINIDKSETIGSYDKLHKITSNNDTFQYQYSISSWIYLNPDSTTNQYVSILDYGNKPKIQYNQYTHTLRIQMLDGKTKMKTIYTTSKFPLQKWNHIVVNYSGSTLDVFINNKLVATKPNIVPYMSYDSIVTGSLENMSGKICNVIYFTKTLSKNNIQQMYLMYNKINPPIL
jgi:hypothetical protein